MRCWGLTEKEEAEKSAENSSTSPNSAEQTSIVEIVDSNSSDMPVNSEKNNSAEIVNQSVANLPTTTTDKKLPSVDSVVKCNSSIAVGKDLEDGELMDVESTHGEQMTWIAASTKKAINKRHW